MVATGFSAVQKNLYRQKAGISGFFLVPKPGNPVTPCLPNAAIETATRFCSQVTVLPDRSQVATDCRTGPKAPFGNWALPLASKNSAASQHCREGRSNANVRKRNFSFVKKPKVPPFCPDVGPGTAVQDVAAEQSLSRTRGTAEFRSKTPAMLAKSRLPTGPTCLYMVRANLILTLKARSARKNVHVTRAQKQKFRFVRSPVTRD